MNASKPCRRTIVLPLLTSVYLLFPAIILTAAAAEPGRERVEFDRHDIPAYLPNLWPKEIKQFVQEPRDKFIALIEQIKAHDRGPRLATLQSAHYEATLVNETLRGGVMTAMVKRLGRESTLLDLGKFSFALDDLKWQGRPAIWGTSADGRTWVFTDGSQEELLGEWSCRGRAIPGGIDFDLQLPAATTSFLDLRIPRGLSVQAPTAEVILISDHPNEKTRLWRIHCGGDQHCRITFLDRAGVEPIHQSLIVETDTDVVIREEDLRFQLNLHLEALDAPIHEITLKVPAGLKIYSAVYGVDTPVPIQRSPESEVDGRLSIGLPGLMKGLRRTLHINGSAALPSGQQIILPQFIVENGTFDGGLLTVAIHSPLQVRSIRAHEYRQRTTNSDQSTFTFQQLTADAQLILDVHRAPIVLSGQQVSVLTVEEDLWNLNSEIRWKSLTGGGYQTSCMFPPDWLVTDVRLKGEAEKNPTFGPFGELPKLNWEVKSHSGGRSELSIEFLDSIQPTLPRTVLVTAQRKAPQPGQSVPVPLPLLLNCDLEKVLFGLDIPSSMTSVFSAESRLERDVRPDPNPFFIPAERPKHERRWYRCDSPEDAGMLQLTPRLQPVHVKAETVIEALPTEYRLKYSIHSNQREAQADRLLVYLTETGPEIRWVWKSSPPIELNAVRLSKAQHLEWDLPSKGELWEIPLPRSMGQGVAIEGTATNRWPVSNRPALLFVPQAVEKLAELRLTKPEDLDLVFDPDGMKPTGEPLCWSYSTPQAEFDFRIHNPEPLREFPPMVSMQVQTIMSADTDGSDIYHILLQLENGSSQDSLHIKLDTSAILQDAFVSGDPIKVTPQAGEFVIPGLNAAGREKVELVYRVPVKSHLFYERRRIVLPHVDSQVLGFFWRFSIPPSMRLFTAPTGTKLLQAPAGPTWNERLFGPLGRSENESIFQPFLWNSWTQLVRPEQTSTTSLTGSNDEFETSFEWQAVAPSLPAEIWLELWHAERVQVLAWISFGLCLLVGTVLQMTGWAHRDRVAAYAMGLTLTAAFSMPSAYVNFFGGATAGILIAILLPRSFLRWRKLTAASSQEGRPELQETILAILLGAITLAGIYTIVDARVFAQESTSEDATSHKRPIVFIPVDRNGKPSETLRWVYVSRDVLDQWKAIAREVGTDPDYLISSARYSVQGAQDGNLKLTAKFRVHLLEESVTPVAIALALEDVSLPDAESCRVNGKPYPINVLPNGKGYSIELTHPPRSSSAASSETVDPGRTEDEIATFEIELHARKARPQTTAFDLQIPKVANSQFEFTLADPASFVEITGGRGSTSRVENSHTMISELGSTSTVQVRWGQTSPARRPPRVTASMLQHLEIHAGYSELLFHLDVAIDEGHLDILELFLPQNATVKKIQSRDDDFLQNDVLVAKDGERRLRLIFGKQHRKSMIVDGTLLLLQTNSLTQTALPKFGLAQSDFFEFHYARNWWGVSTSSDFHLEASNLDPENVNTILPIPYLNAWSAAADPGHHDSLIPHQPQYTFELREGTIPSFTLIPHQPQRRANLWKQTGFVGRNRLEWTAEGEIVISHPSTFQTALLVDRRLRIEDVSVKENDAERKTRWSESRDPARVVVFLSDKTQGKQTIKLRGSLPLTPGAVIQLPSIRVEDCDMGTTDLILTHDPEVEVAFTPPPAWKPRPNDEASVEGDHAIGAKLLGKFQLKDLSARGTLQTSARHSRCSSRTAVVLSRTDARAWHLRYRIEMTPDGESPVRMGLIFPAAFKDINAVTAERAELDWREPQDGLRHLDLILNRSHPQGTVVLRFEITLDEPQQPDWQLPLPTPLYSHRQETLIAIDQHEPIWFPKGSREIRASELPDWSSRFYEDVPKDASAFTLSGPTIQLQRDISKTDLRPPSIRLLDQRIWVREGGMRSGTTQAFLSSLRSDLEFRLPAGTHVTSVFLDDHPLALTAASDDRMTIPAVDIGSESLLTITWSFDAARAGLLTSEPFLWPLGIPVEKNVITILPEAPVELSCRKGLTIMNSVDQGLDRLEALLNRQSALRIESDEALANRWMLDRIYARLKTEIASEVRHPNEEVSRQLKRWNDVVRQLNLLEPAPAMAPANWSVRLLDEPDVQTESAVRGSITSENSVEICEIDRRYLQLAFSLVLPLLLIPILRRTIRVEWSDWLHRHVAVSWLLLATVWWLFLTPSAVGSLLLIVAIHRAAVQYRPKKSVG